MKRMLAWSMIGLGAAHIGFGVLRFKVALLEAFQSGFIGQFYEPERRVAFWFLIVGPMLVLIGHLALRGIASGDPHILKIIGYYGLVIAAVGILAFPKSPLWLLLALSIAMLTVSYKQ